MENSMAEESLKRKTFLVKEYGKMEKGLNGLMSKSKIAKSKSLKNNKNHNSLPTRVRKSQKIL